MDAKGLVVQPGQGAVWNMSPGRSAALKLQNAETAESVMAFEETAPPGTDTTFHLHYDSGADLCSERRVHVQDRRPGRNRRTRDLCLHTARHCACLEEHRSRSRAGAVPLHAGWCGQDVRGGEAPSAPAFVDGRARGWRVLWLGDHRASPVLSGIVAALADPCPNLFRTQGRPSARIWAIPALASLSL